MSIIMSMIMIITNIMVAGLGLVIIVSQEHIFCLLAVMRILMSMCMCMCIIVSFIDIILFVTADDIALLHYDLFVMLLMITIFIIIIIIIIIVIDSVGIVDVHFGALDL